MNIPIYIASIKNNEDGITCISLVDSPAVETDFQAFNNQKILEKLSIVDEDEHIILGPVMIADMLIYRNSPQLGEYYIKYEAETIKQMAQKMFEDKTYNNISLDHNGKEINGVNLIELFIKDTEKGIDPVGFDEVTNGSLFAKYKVEDSNLWKQIKNGQFRGFSLEGWFSIDKEQKKIKNKYAIMTKNLFKLLKTFIKCGEIATDKDKLYWIGDEDLVAGTEVFTDENAETPAADGEYVTEDGKTITVKDGVVESIVDPAAQAAPEEMEDEFPTEPTEPAEQTEPEWKSAISELEAKIEAIAEIVDMLAKKLEAIEAVPAEDPIEETFSKQKIGFNTGKMSLVGF